jgi:hypothetical protein
MPIWTALNHVESILANLPLPGSGGSTLATFIRPPDPESDQSLPHAYVWPGRGTEMRESVPRPQQGTPGTGSTQAGWKQKHHMVDVWVTWFQDQDDPTPDASFPVIMDAIEDALRCSTDPVKVQDPVTFRWSQLFATGEDMDYDIGLPRATRDQRILRYDGKVSLTVKESFQA